MPSRLRLTLIDRLIFDWLYQLRPSAERRRDRPTRDDGAMAPVGRKNLNVIVFSRSARLLLLEKEPGGADGSVARVGDCSLFQAARVLGGGERLLATAAAGATARAASASNSRRRPALLGAGVPLVR